MVWMSGSRLNRALVAATGAAGMVILGFGLSGCGGTQGKADAADADTRPERPVEAEPFPTREADASDADPSISPFATPAKPSRLALGDQARHPGSPAEKPLEITLKGETPGEEPPPSVAPAGPEAAVMPPADINTQISAKAAELRTLLAERAATAGSPLSANLTLAAFDAATGPSVSTDKITGLSPAEQKIALAARDVFTGLVHGPGLTGNPDKTADVLSSAAKALSKDSGVRISFAGLCRKVDSFGRFELFPTTAFLAGRAQRAVVYVELDRFSSRPPTSTDSEASAGAQWVVEVSQELELIHDADGRQQWYRPAQTVSDSSRTQRRDFYLVNTIDLPATLTVGAYSLKVTIRDKTTGATDERILPLQIIADPSALQSPRASTASR